ncbi:nitroreductase family deazaflavin-dependent oxidoreductase [Intrasporangium sp.]|uniref:nitroreductase family deazaflavin-dependent oxidoreductase n=1 Tax=Intrasporangium sp. TaxID=1925024 RepID=UPI003977BCFC
MVLRTRARGCLTMAGDYVPSPRGWVRRQVEQIEATGTTESVDILGRPVVLVTMRGAKSGAIRKVPLMRVVRDGVYAAVGSQGGSPDHPQWVHNLRAHPEVDLQDGRDTFRVRARELTPDERDEWWPVCVAAFPPYAEYQEKTDRVIPVFVLERV